MSGIGEGWIQLGRELGEELARLKPPGRLERIVIDSSGLPRFVVRLDAGNANPGRELVRRYENLACERCESCGEPGRVRAGVVIQIACDHCAG